MKTEMFCNETCFCGKCACMDKTEREIQNVKQNKKKHPSWKIHLDVSLCGHSNKDWKRHWGRGGDCWDHRHEKEFHI